MTLGSDGRRKTFYGKTRKDVSERLKVAMRDQQQGTMVSNDRQTVAQYLGRWLAESVKGSVKARTHVGYESIVRVRIVPRIGRVPLARLTSLDLQGLYTKLAADGLSGRSIVHTHRVLHRALQQACRWGMLPRNPCDGVTPPQAQRRELGVLSQAEAAHLLTATIDHPAHALYVLALSTGMRQGELLGLQWRDIDLEAGRVSVRRAVQRQKGVGLVFVTPKTARSRRSVKLGQRAVAALRDHRLRQIEARLRLGPDWRDEDLVFANETGGKLDPSHQTAVFKVALSRAGLPAIRFHDLRHSAATLLLTKGIHPKVVSEMLGHSTVTLTLDVYSHYTPVLHDQAAAAMDDLLAG